jgi:hypothetical protein
MDLNQSVFMESILSMFVNDKIESELFLYKMCGVS